MGRIYTAAPPTINKSVINNSITSTLTSVYTNATGAGAELRAVNINGLQNNATINSTASGAQEWTPFGSNVNPIISYSGATTYYFGEPYQVQLSANRVLLFFLPHSHHRCGSLDFFGGTMIHTQIVEYQTNKYVAGPIQNHTLPYAWFSDFSYNLWSRPDSGSSSSQQPCWRAIALTANKVAVVCQQRSTKWLMRFTITGNTVDHLVTSLDMSTAFGNPSSYPFALEIVPDNTDKVIVASGASSGNWSAQAFNMANTGAITTAGSLQSLGIAQSLYNIGMCKMVKTATANITPYLFAVTTAATTSQAIAFNFNSSTNAWTSAATAVSLAAVSTTHTGLECACLSTGTTVNAVIAATTGNTAGDGLVTFYRQTSSTTLANTRTTLTTQHTTNKSISEHYQWGDERVVFVGEYGCLVCYDSAGIATCLINSVTESISVVRYSTKWYPFNSRPLYVYYDPKTINANATGNYKARVNSTGTTTSVGQTSHTGNYLPWGYDYGEGYAWNEPAGCWVVVQGNRIYALNTSGVILSEMNASNLYAGVDYRFSLSQIQVTATGRLLLAWDYGIKVMPSSGYSPHNSYTSFSASGALGVTEPMTSYTQLPNLKAQNSYVSPSGNVNGSHLFGHMVYSSDISSPGSEYAYILYISASSVQLRCAHFNGTTWADVNPTTPGSSNVLIDGSWTTGYRFNFKLIQDTPGSTALPKGLWRILGSYNQDTAANHSYNGISNAYSIISSFNSMATITNPLSGNTSTSITQGWGSPAYVHSGRSGTQVTSIYDEILGCPRIYASVNGRLADWQGYYTPWAPVQVISTTVTTNIITVTSTTGMYTGMAVRFNGPSGLGNITIGTTYYVLSGFTSTTFTVSTTIGGSALSLSTASISTMTVSYFTSHRWTQIAASKFGYIVALQNTSQVDQQAFAYTFTSADPYNASSTPIATTGSGWMVLYRTGKNSWQLYNSTSSLNYTYTSYGIPDDVRFYLTLDDNAGNVFYLNNGQTLSPNDTTTGLYRSETVYQIPSGYSIKASCDTPNVIGLLLTIKEMQ
jgi:hypothetical protein